MEIRKFNKDEINIFSGSASLELSKKIVEYLGVELSEIRFRSLLMGKFLRNRWKVLEEVRHLLYNRLLVM